ncbi:FAD-dependent oxidoreductase [Candidatus Micrarchaeota archaeon]|nr:FAD-dependent oxidoreductase [Candidatus Micrarchaeota archaeon]MBU2476201.1 FAD-dependent oxidoreductase [Candidatus Micrarchaeota archaeon]
MEFKSKILEIEKCFDERNLFQIMKFEKPKDFSFESGQFVMISSDDFKLRDNPEQLKWSSFSIASSPFQKYIELCIRILDSNGFTHHLSSKNKGDKINFKGPFGNFKLNKEFKEIAFVALGTGIAPMISMIKTLLHENNGKPMHLFYGFRNRCCFLYHEELMELQKNHKNFKLDFIPSDPEQDWDVPKGYVQSLIEKAVFSVSKKEVDFYMCGPPKALEALNEFLIEQNFSKEKIHYEKWG